ncbi:hypothetical protein [Gracilibacillus kekensis]|uniref:Uncharacterized protein n=1 Tax=Gracilibacillus kekensis TaxID=1027249 RepID=A0A1M7QLB5_9BACI|nr:hypothetical protein [Gracilibacillus kekensis]SHN31708.1 hypothetical protein SAMN05216179_3302 [Gracilibacillus kekensis]
MLAVQKIEKATLVESSQKFVTDKTNISSILNAFEENTDQFKEYTDPISNKLQSESYYSLAFFKGKENETPQKGTYAIHLFDDDTMIFTDVTKNKSYINQDPNDDLLNIFKNMISIP